ncbi:hypothetical protein SCACP_36850 [Sporomusa carbonis]
MKLMRAAVLLLTAFLLLGAGATALAAEQWVTDPNTGAKICIMSMTDDVTLVAARWSGPEAGGPDAGSTPSGAATEKAAKVLGIPWGASEDEARRIMQERPGTKHQVTEKIANNTTRQRYIGPFNDDQAVIIVSFYQGKMFAVSILHFRSADQVMDKFNELKAGMSQRYGSPFKESGKYLDSSAWWVLDPNHRAGLIIVRNDIGQTDQSFATMLSYWQADLGRLLGSAAAGGKDY